MRTEAASVFLLTPDRRELVCHACAGPVDLQGARFDSTKGIAGRAIATGQVQLIRDTRESASFFGEIDEATGFRTRSILCCPSHCCLCRSPTIQYFLSRSCRRNRPTYPHSAGTPSP